LEISSDILIISFLSASFFAFLVYPISRFYYGKDIIFSQMIRAGMSGMSIIAAFSGYSCILTSITHLNLGAIPCLFVGATYLNKLAIKQLIFLSKDD